MSDFVIMPKADYVAACNSVRAKTGKSDTIKSGDLSSEIDSITGGGGSSDDVRYVTFMSYDGAVEYLRLPVAVGYDCPNPKIDTPKKESDVQYNYTFAGWATTPNGGLDSNALKAVNEDRTVYANFAAVLRSYTITFLDTDGSVLATKTVVYGSIPSYTPTKDGYDFVGWEPELAAVTGEASYTAKWKEQAQFATATWAEIANIIANDEIAQYFAIGDTKKVTLNYSDGTTEDITFEIVDTDTSGIISGTSIALLAQHTLEEPRAFHSTNSTSLYYMFSNLLTYLNGTLTGCFPEDMQAVMKSVSMPYASGSSKVHVPTDNMLFGYYYDYTVSNPIADKNDMLSAFKNEKSKICKSPDGTNVDYWLAHTGKPNASIKNLYPSYVSASGVLSIDSATTTKYIRPLVFL